MPPLASMTHAGAEYRCECGRRYSATFVIQPLNGPGRDEPAADTGDQLDTRCNARSRINGRTCWKDKGHETKDDPLHSWELTAANG